MLLAADIGNTAVDLGLFDGPRLSWTWQLAADAQRTADETGLVIVGCLRHAGFEPGRVTAVAIASVVPRLEELYVDAVERFLGQTAWVVTHDADLGLVNRTAAPDQVGLDRLLAAAAAYRLHGGPLVVLTFGTATTVNAVSRQGEFLGGAIAPGLVTAHDALVGRTARLPQIPLVPPERAIGRNTLEAMQAGLMLGYVGLVEELIRRVQDELEPCPVIATGGLAATLAAATQRVSLVAPHLTLLGIQLAYARQVVHVGAAGG